MTHDPMSLLPAGDAPVLSPWESLAQQCRWLAEMADRCSHVLASDLAPVVDDDNPADVLAELDARALAIRSAVSACRRATWQALRDQGVSYAEIGRQWGCSGANVRQVLVAQDRAR